MIKWNPKRQGKKPLDKTAAERTCCWNNEDRIMDNDCSASDEEEKLCLLQSRHPLRESQKLVTTDWAKVRKKALKKKILA